LATEKNPKLEIVTVYRLSSGSAVREFSQRIPNPILAVDGVPLNKRELAALFSSDHGGLDINFPRRRQHLFNIKTEPTKR
jgi:hypothetical protein